MYRTSEKKTSTGMASWFSVENWSDGPSLRDDGTQLYIKRSQHLDQYVSHLSKKKWVAIAKACALEMRAVIKEQKKVRKGKQRAVMMERPANDSNDDEDWEENMHSDPVNPDEQ